MSCSMHGAETITIKKSFFFLWQGLMSALMFHFFLFLNFDLYFKRHILGKFRSYGLAFVPKYYKYSWCNQ